MKRTAPIIATFVVLIAGGGTLLVHARNSVPATKYITAKAAKGTLISTVSGTGNVVAGQFIKVNPSITGAVTNLSVKLGDLVTKGQTLFTVYNDSLGVMADKSYSSYLQSKQVLLTVKSQLVTAQAAATNQAQDSGQAKAQAALDASNQQLAVSQTTLAQDQQVLQALSPSAPTYVALQSKVVADQASVGANQSNAASATISAQQSQVSGTANVASSQLQLSAAQQAVTIAQKNVENAWADYTNQKASAEQRTVTAPISGTITTLSIGNGDQLGSSSGASSSSSASPIVIEDLGSLQSTVQINEVDAPTVSVGQKTSMTFDAISGLTLTGTVEKIDAVGTVVSGVVTYGSTINFDSLDSRLRPGMSISGIITTTVKQDVLSVPSTAVKSQGGSTYVQILENGVPVQQTVQIGATSDTATEITSGLNESDTVVTQTITSAQALAKTSATSGIPGLTGGNATSLRSASGGGRGGN